MIKVEVKDGRFEASMEGMSNDITIEFVLLVESLAKELLEEDAIKKSKLVKIMKRITNDIKSDFKLYNNCIDTKEVKKNEMDVQ